MGKLKLQGWLDLCFSFHHFNSIPFQVAVCVRRRPSTHCLRSQEQPTVCKVDESTIGTVLEMVNKRKNKMKIHLILNQRHFSVK